MRTCNCVGYMTNPGGVCCMDLPTAPVITTRGTAAPIPLDEERIRQIIREEIERSKVKS